MPDQTFPQVHLVASDPRAAYQLGLVSGHLLKLPCCASEAELQDAIATALLDKAAREVRLGPRSIIDFLVGGVGIEVKMAGSTPAVTRQILRYLESPRIEALLLVTTRRQHAVLAGTRLGKPVAVHVLQGGIE